MKDKYQVEPQKNEKFEEVLTSDNICISTYEYIDLFLITRGYETTHSNRLKVAESLERCTWRARHPASELDHWLDSQFKN